jgi:glyoxylase-like metal-dependent hydrolase (beta-lactamase superfamily II)
MSDGSDRRRRGGRYRSVVRARERVELARLVRDDDTRQVAAFEQALSTLDDATEVSDQQALLAANTRRLGPDRQVDDEELQGIGGLHVVRSSSRDLFVRVKVETFPGHVNYCYAIKLVDGTRVLWDVGTGHAHSRDDLLLGVRGAGVLLDEPIALDAFDVIIISHGHIDHFGDVRWFKEQTGAELWVHELDARVLERWDERVIMNGREMRAWLGKAGIGEERVEQLLGMYLASKGLYASEGVVVDRRLRHGQRLFDGRARVIHTPGHCPGHVCLQLGEVLLVADQVLSPITPHISPQALHPHNGIERYLAGLARLRGLEGIRHVLPAHYDPILDLGERIDDIVRHHAERSQAVLAFCEAPRTVKDVARELYGEQSGYNVLLALQEAGAHVEYLHQVGGLAIANLAELESDPAAPVRYRAGSATTVRPTVQPSGEGAPVAE